MSCITKGNVRCTKCCEAIHINKRHWQKIKRGLVTIGKSQPILKYWKPISARRAKKINPYIWDNPSSPDDFNPNKGMQFFTCTALDKGVGCTVRDQEDHPEVCKVFTADPSYSPTCEFDINIIARG